jgi:ADP-ribosylglycohydrolase
LIDKVTIGLAGVYYGLKEITKEWIAAIARKEDIGKVFGRFPIT